MSINVLLYLQFLKRGDISDVGFTEQPANIPLALSSLGAARR